MSDENKSAVTRAAAAGKAEKPTVTLRPREALLNARKAEIVRAMRDASEATQIVPVEWVQELAELVDVDLRRR